MRVLAWVGFCSLLFACGGSGDDPDSGGEDVLPDSGEVDTGPTCDGVDALEMPTAAPHDDPLGAPVGEARAGVLGADDLPEDPGGLIRWAEGDLVVANNRVALVIENAGASDGYDPFGGKPVGLARVEGGAMVEPADFNEVIPAVGRFVVNPESVGVLRDGSDGGPAVVRAVGPLAQIPFIGDLAAGLAPGNFEDLRVAVDYSLAPDADVVDVTYTLSNPRAGGVGTRPIFLIFQYYRMDEFWSDTGFEVPLGSDLPWLGFAADEATSYAVAFEPTAFITVEISGALLLQGDRYTVPECANTALPYYRLHIGRGTSGVRESIWADAGQTSRRIEGVVRDADGNPAGGVHVHAESADGELYYGRDLTDEAGAYSVAVPDEATTRLRAYRRGEGIVGPVDGPDIDLPATGTIRVVATDGSGTAMPVRVQSRPVGDGEPRPPSRFGEPPIQSQRTHVEYPSDGVQELRVLPGMHRVIVSRGYEYTMFDSDVDVPEGDTVQLDVMLDRVVDTTGVMCADYHIHTSRSPDSPDPAELKLRSAAADGVELPCRSDHEWIWEWDDIAQNLGLGDHLYGVTSTELTTFAWGHFGVAPVNRIPGAVNEGAFGWVDRAPAQVFADVHDRPEDPVLIVNHPRGSALSGYFSAVGYDPITGEVSNADLWSEDFEAIEVFNSDSFDETTDTVTDWFSFLNQGRRVWAVGSSDTHRLSGSPVGYPRTCLEVGSDDPAAFRASGMADDAVRDATRDGRFTISGGIYLSVTGRDGVGPGGEISSAMATESIRVVVQAAPWVDVDALEVWADGEMVESIAIDPSMDVVRFDEMVDVSDANWVVFHAKGDESLDPVHPGRSPFGVTQPIFFTR